MFNIQSFLGKHFRSDEPIVLGCSTGADSMFLLYKILETPYKDNLVACYFNHKTRPETDIEEKFLEELGKEKGFTVEVASCDFDKIKKLYPSKSFEELAREKRYQFFEAICHIHKTKKVLTAHHLDDKIETFFFNLVRGSKLTGLINMTESSGNILRPLLSLKKSEIEKFLKENNLKHFIDSTNSNTDFSRNKLRRDILPKFEEINSNYKGNLNNIFSYFEELKNHLDQEVKRFLEGDAQGSISDRILHSQKGQNKKSSFKINDFNVLSSLLQKEVIRYIYYISNNKSTIGLSKNNIDETIRFINGKNNKTKKEIRDMKMFKDGSHIFY